MKGRKELMEMLESNGITSHCVEHPAVFTVDAMIEHLKDIDGLVTKNLFLKDKKKKLWLLTAVHSKDVKLSDVGKTVGAPGGLRFTDESVMIEKLGVAQGCCTPMSLINDVNKDVKFIVDSDLLNEGVMVYSHPLENTASLGISSEDFKKFLASTGHEPVLLDI